MALSAGRMSTMPPTLQPAGCGLSPDEECLAVSLLMLSRGVREEPPAFLADVAEPPEPAPPLVAHQAAPAAAAAEAAASPTPEASVDVVAPSLPLTPVVAVGPSAGRDEVILTVQSPSPVLAPVDMMVITPSLTPRQQVPPLPAVAVGPNVEPEQVVVVTEEEQALAAKIQAPPELQLETPAVGPSSSRSRRQPPRYECGVCRKTFSTSRGLKVHVTSHPDRGRLYPCEFCATIFSSSSELRWHVRRSQTCGGSKPRRLRAAAAAAIAWHRIDLNDMPEN